MNYLYMFIFHTSNIIKMLLMDFYVNFLWTILKDVNVMGIHAYGESNEYTSCRDLI